MKLSTKQKERGLLAVAVFVPLVLVFGIDCFLHWSAMHPRFTEKLPKSARHLVRAIALAEYRVTVQATAGCLRHDPEILYTLKPGQCLLSDREFETPILVNSLGVRDDQASLQKPEIVVLGDSYAMGSGVQQEETFAQRLEKISQLRVLNAGVSSYGTVREMMMLDRIDTSQMKALVVQYCPNDFEENQSFAQNGNRYISLRHQSIQALIASPAVPRSEYSPLLALKTAWRVGRPGRPQDRSAELGYFLNALEHAGKGLPKVPIYVFGIGPHSGAAAHFTRQLQKRLDEKQGPAFLKQLRLLDVTAGMVPDDWYTLDDHLRASGHQAIASQLWDYIRSGK